MTTFLPFHRPDITSREIEAVTAVLESGWLTSGPNVRGFEAAFATAVSARHAVAVNSCTAALHLALDVVGVGEGDEVILPTVTFAATGGVVGNVGATPVLVDIDPADHTISVEAVERATSEHTRAIIPVDYAGQPADLERLLAWAKPRGIRVIEDAAHAFPASLRGRPVGSIADITCFSFYATKTITCGEGGMATTEREDWAARMRLMSLHGISRDAWNRADFPRPWLYDVTDLGWKYNLSDIAAALGLVQLERAEAMLARRREIGERYRSLFCDHPAIELITVYPDRETAWHLFVIKLVTEALTIDRDRFMEELRTRGIGASLHFVPLHLHSYYRRTQRFAERDFPNAMDVFRRSLSLPIYSAMTDVDVDRVGEAVLDICREYLR
jgi:perosamine synthetase